MKNHINKALVALVLVSAGAQLQAYTYEFSNHTNKTIAISLTYKGIGEYARVRVAQPHTQVSFMTGGIDIASSKAGLVPSSFAYIANPPAAVVTTEIRDNKTRNDYLWYQVSKFPWKAFNITWLPSEEYTLAIELAEQLGSASEKAAQLAMKAGAAYATGGASAAAEGAAELAKQAAAKTKAEVLKTAAGTEFSLGKIIASIGKTAARSLMGRHHFDIVEDETGKISFIALL